MPASTCFDHPGALFLPAMSAMPPDSPRLPETPTEAITATVRERVVVEGRTFLLDRPAESDRLLDHPALLERLGTEYMPYWVDLWPAARMLAKWILKQHWPAGLHALEVGCGLGLPGIAALAMGVHVTFSDYDATAVRYARDNARLNGFHDCDTLQMDWAAPPAERRWQVILASDLIYEIGNVEPLVGLIKALLPADGVCLLTDQDRVPAHVLRETLAREGLPCTTSMLRAGEPGGTRLKGTLYRITQPGGRDPLLP